MIDVDSWDDIMNIDLKSLKKHELIILASGLIKAINKHFKTIDRMCEKYE